MGHGVNNRDGKEDSENEEHDTRVVPERARTITFDPSTEKHPTGDETLYIPGPRERERGMHPQLLTCCSQPVLYINSRPGLPLVELSKRNSRDDRDGGTFRNEYYREGIGSSLRCVFL